MAFTILNMLFNVCMLSVLLIAYKRKDKSLFCSAWALYGVPDIYWNFPYVVFYIYYHIPILFQIRMGGVVTNTLFSYLNCLLGCIFVIAAYFLYRGKDWAYHIIRGYCHIGVAVYAIACPFGIISIISLFYKNNAISQVLEKIPGICNLIISIMFILFSIKYLNTIRPAIKEKIIKRNRTFEKEEISCPECGNIIPTDSDICSKCNWTYADDKGNQ